MHGIQSTLPARQEVSMPSKPGQEPSSNENDRQGRRDDPREDEHLADQYNDNDEAMLDATHDGPTKLDRPIQVTIPRSLRRTTQRIGDPLHIGGAITSVSHTAGDDTPSALPSVPPCTPIAEKPMPLQFASLMPLTTIRPLEQSYGSVPTLQRSRTMKHCSYDLQDHRHHMQAALHDDATPKMGRGKVELLAEQNEKDNPNYSEGESGDEPRFWKGYGCSSGRGTPVFMD